MAAVTVRMNMLMSYRHENGGLEAVITCIDPSQLNPKLAGRRFGHSLLADLPASADPCGEHGEFHTFVFNAPLFKKAIPITVGDIVTRDNFVFADVT